MPLPEPKWEPRHLRAPTENGQWLTIPSRSEMPVVVRENQRVIADWSGSWLGRPLVELRRMARREVARLAEQFTRRVNPHSRLAARTTMTCVEDAPWILSGHQPELFHPGVWAKNFVLSQLATEVGGICLNLIVDNDLVGSTSVAVPVGMRDAPYLERIPFDVEAGGIPWEEATLQSEPLFRSFSERVTAALSCWSFSPLLKTIWTTVIQRLKNEPANWSLGELLTVARCQAEQLFGLRNWELPISQLANTESFAWFVAELIRDPARTLSVYNQVVTEYRTVNHVRNHQHPVADLTQGRLPELHAEDDWWESPFWIWRAGDRRRGRLFVRVQQESHQLSNGRSLVAEWPRLPEGRGEDWVSVLFELSSRGWKIRPRALTNTLFARLFLADTFIHGIGGAKYDEMTDRLFTRLAGVAPPSYLTVTATCHLPVAGWTTTRDDESSLRHQLWDFDHNPERHVADSDWPNEVRHEVESFLAEKQRLIQQQNARHAEGNASSPGSKAEHNQCRRRLSFLSQQLALRASTARAALHSEWKTAQSQLAANAILKSREFAFCLFPQEFFREFAATNGDD